MVITAGMTTASCSVNDTPSVPQNSALAEALVGEWIEEYDPDGTNTLFITTIYHFYDDGTCWKELNYVEDSKVDDILVSRYATGQSTYTIDASGRVVMTVKNVETDTEETEELTFDGTHLSVTYAVEPITLIRATDAQVQFYQAEVDAWHGGSDDGGEVAVGHPLSEAEVFDVVSSDGLAYKVNDKQSLPEGVTGVAMVAYKNGTNGLALSLINDALVDDGKYVDVNMAKSICESKPAVPGATWRLPSIYDWQNMLIGSGVRGTVSDNPTSMKYYTVLSSKLVSVGGARISINGVDFWSSTEYTPNHQFWHLTFFGGTVRFSTAPASNRYSARACLAF